MTVAAPVPLWAPLRASLAWLGGTYLLFLLVGETTKVPDLFKLSAYVAFATGCLAAGYWLRAVRYRGVAATPVEDETPSDVVAIRLLSALSALYYLAYGVVYMREFGVLGAGSVIDALLNPGSAYLAKFDVFASQETTQSNNPAAQALTLAAVLAAPLVPFAVLYWRHLTGDVRLLAGLGLAAYATFYLAIGTLVGLGNILIFAGVSFLVVRARGARRRQTRRWVTALILIGSLSFAGYMAYNQSARIEAVGISQKYQPNPIVKALAGEDLARGVTVVAFYPTHGYQGLGYSLDQPFVWTHGRGAARALDSYLTQYGFGDGVSTDTYPARTERKTGWDSRIYWSTIYPWLASDLTFFGAALFMGLVGWWMARFWYEAIAHGSRLALLLLCQLGVLIAFIPANNQIGLSRPNLIGFVTLAALYALAALRRKRRSEEPARHLEAENDVRRRRDVRRGVVVNHVGDRVGSRDLR